MPPARSGGPVVLSHLETGDDHHQHTCGLAAPDTPLSQQAAKIAAIPMILTALVVFVGRNDLDGVSIRSPTPSCCPGRNFVGS
jgi:hypothetical protein